MKRGRLLKTTRGDVGLISKAHAARLLCHGRIVVDRVRCDQLVGQLELAVVEALLKQLA